MIHRETADAILDQLDQSSLTGAEFRGEAMRRLSELPNYNWCGVYRLDRDSLILDEYVGEPTDHTVIPVGRGVCGTAVAENRNQIIENVNELSNYLACSTTTKSEIVVLIKTLSGQILGQIDIDGHVVGAFDATDEEMLVRIATLLASRWY